MSHHSDTILSPEARERINVEQQLVHAVIDAVIDAGLLISVYHPGGKWACRHSHNADAVKRALAWSEVDDLSIYRPYTAGVGYERVGSISLAYGSGWDILSDYTYDLTDVIPALTYILP